MKSFPARNRRSPSKKIALFVTHGAPEYAAHLHGWLDKFFQVVVGAEILGMFNCQGKCSEAMLNLLRNSGNPEFVKWADRYVPNSQPDATRVKRAREFAQEMMKKFKSNA